MEPTETGPSIPQLAWTSEKRGEELEGFPVIETHPDPVRHSRDDSQKLTAPDAICLVPGLLLEGEAYYKFLCSESASVPPLLR